MPSYGNIPVNTVCGALSMVAGVTICGELVAAVALQAGAHGVRGWGVWGRVTLCTADTGGSMPAMVKMHISR